MRYQMPFRFLSILMIVSMLLSAVGVPMVDVLAAPTGKAVQFDGTNDYVTFGQASGLGAQTFTLEAWIKRATGGKLMGTGTAGLGDGFPQAYPVLTKGRGQAETPLNVNMNYWFGIASTGVVAADFEDSNDGLNHPVLGMTVIPLNEWHHIAVTYGGGCWNVYVDGNLDSLNSSTVQCPKIRNSTTVSALPESTSIQHAALSTALQSNGTLPTDSGYFSGAIDEARIWNRALPLSEIQANRYNELTSGTGLLARWGMNENTGTTINSSVGTFSGVMTNGPTWVDGFPVPDSTPPAAPTGLTATPYSGAVGLTWTPPADMDIAGYNIYRSETSPVALTSPVNDGTLISGTAYTDSGRTNGTEYYYVVAAVDTSTNQSVASNEVSATPLASLGSGLNFDGTNDYVTFGTASGLGVTNFTLETWFYWTGGGATTTTSGTQGLPTVIPLVSKGRGESDGNNLDMNFFLGIDTTTNALAADFEDMASGMNHPVTAVTPITTNMWHHAAVTYDSVRGVWNLYLDGVLDRTLDIGDNVLPRSDSIQHAGLGTAMTSTGVMAGYLQGKLDEVRIWNRALSLAEIIANINSEVTSGSGLVARWGLNEGTGTVINSSIGTLTGTLTNGPAWTTGAPFNLAFNAAPSQPTLVSPSNGGSVPNLSPTLSAAVSDPESDPLTVQFYGRTLTSSASPFSIVILPDTQNYTNPSNQPLGATIFNTQTNWVVNNLTARNIAFVNHLGDITESGGNDADNSEWIIGDAAFDILDSGNVPYNVAPGNHDMAGGATRFENYFGVARFTGKSYYGGHYGADNTNNYNLFSASGMDFILINLNCPSAAPAAEVLTWASNLLASNASRRGIVACHDLLTTSNVFSTAGAAVYNALRGNPNLFILLGGHLDQAGARTDTYNGNTVYSLRSDYQSQSNGGNGWLRILEFQPANNKVQVYTYSPYLNNSMTDATNQFSLDYGMSGAWQLIDTVNVPSGDTASVTWSGLTNNTQYEWYAVASDAGKSATSATWSFTTNVGVTNQPPVITEGDSVDITMSEDGTPTPFTLTLNATDPDAGDTLTWSVSSEASHGTASSAGTGLSKAIGYIPTASYSGVDSFAVTVSDGNGGADAITVNVTITPTATEPADLSCITIQPKPMTATTGEKPQSKVWKYNGEWYAVFPTSASGASSAGSWLWKLQGTTWTEVLKLSSATNTKADVKVVGNLAHILLYNDPATQLASVEFIGGTYQLWSARSELTSVNLPGSEIATIDIDSTGRMWLATRQDSPSPAKIVVYYSDSPYTTFQGPVEIASGVVGGDDISVITAMPDNKIGILWSNQNTERFGFRIHNDGDDPTIWSTDEVPASQSAIDNVGTGMADDHLNVKVASDGTLYAAVKTGYDTSGYPKMALLVRRPNGLWDNLYGLDEAGTRGNIELDEASGVLTFIHTQAEGNNPIVYRQSNLDPISFGAKKTLRAESFNDVSSTKQNYNGELVVIYANGTQVGGQICTGAPITGADLAITKTSGASVMRPGDTLTYMIQVTNNGPQAVTGATVTDTLPATLTTVSWICAGANAGTCTASGTGNINDVVNLPVNASVTYTVSAKVDLGTRGTLTNTAIVTMPVGVIDSNTGNNTATDTDTIIADSTSCGSDPTLVGCWQMEEGNGTVLVDGSIFANDANIVGTPAWAIGKVGTYALDLNGTSQYAAVSDDASLDLTNQITLAAWIKPEKYGTQDILKKATNGVTDGYELTLASTKADSSSQRVFFRINQVASGDTNRINATTMYPIDGTWMHVAATYDGATMKLYINGVLETSLITTVPITTNNLPLTIGAQDGATASRWFMGWLDDARVYNRALSAVEIQSLFGNTAPVAMDDAYSTNEDITLDVPAPGVLGNDTDTENNPLTAIKLTDPTHGALTFNNDGSFTYIPTSNFNGSDSFTYRASDGTDSNVATVNLTITAVNDAPVASDQTAAATEDVSQGITLAATDIDGNPLTYSVGTPAHGTLIGAAPNLTYTPNTNYYGSDSFTFKVNDGLVDSSVATVTININAVNDAPVAVSQYISIDRNISKSITLTGFDVESLPLTFTIVASPAHGSLSGAAPTITYMPDTGYVGADEFTFKVNDGSLDSMTATVSILVTDIGIPPLPSSFYGEIHIFDTPPSVGNTVEAYMPGEMVALATTVIGSYQGTLVYSIDVPAGSDGVAAEGDAITFKINGRIVATGIWHTGTNIRLDFHPPQPIPGGPYVGNEGTAVNFNGSANDWGTDANLYQWDWDNDGTYDQTAQNPSHTWTQDGTNTVGLKVTDAQGGIGITTVIVTVNNVAPTVDAGGPYTGNEDATINFTGTASDVGADTLTYAWDFEYDGITFDADANGSLIASHIYTVPGIYTIALRVNDDDTSVIDTAAVTVTNVNDAPVITGQTPAPLMVDEDTSLMITLGNLSVVDPDNTYPADFTLSVLAGANYTVLNNTITPALNFNGMLTVPVNVYDGGLYSNNFNLSVSVTPVNDVPVADPQTITTDEDIAKTITLTGSDVEAGLTFILVDAPTHGDLTGIAPDLTYTPDANYHGVDAFTFKVNDGSVDSIPVTVSIMISPINDAPVCSNVAISTNEDAIGSVAPNCVDVDGDPLNYTLGGTPAHGATSFFEGLITYQPNANYNGSDSFTYTANDGLLTSNVAVVSVIVTAVNDAPTATAQSVTTDEDTTLALPITGSDIDDDPLSYTVTVTPAHGILTGTAPNLTYTPAANYNGTDLFKFKVSDGLLESAEATVTIAINAVNDAPVITGQGTLSTNEDTAITVALADLSVSDVDNTYPVGFSLTVQSGANYTFIGNTVTPSHNFHGALSVSVKVNDGASDSNVYNLLITVNDVFPSNADAGGPYAPVAGQPITLNGSATCAPVDVCTFAWDLDGDTAYDDATGPSPVHTWNLPGNYTIGLRVTDDDGNSIFDTATVEITAAIHSIALVPGWNLVSFNVHPTDTAIASVLASIHDQYDLVYAWDATGAHVASGNWLKADNIPFSPDTLTNLDETMGFWIHMGSAAILEIVGSVPISTNIDLSVNAGGWNLVGYPSLGEQAMPDVLANHGVGTDFGLVFAYHPEDVSDPWKLYDTTAPIPLINDLQVLSPGWGYWIKVSANHTWNVMYMP